MNENDISDISIVIPSKNGARPLRRLLPELLRLFPANILVEIVVVDDGSRPPLAALSGPWNESKSIRLVRLDRNRGQQRATMTGIRHARFAWIATIDDDGHPAGVLPRMVARARRGYDLVYGAPVARRPRYGRFAGTLANNALFRIWLGKPARVRVTSLRLIRGTLARRAVITPVSYPYLSAMLLSFQPATACVYFFADPGGSKSRYDLRALTRILFALLFYWGPFRSLGRAVSPPRVADA